ncbi:MAG: tellurium resistance protein [Pseudorhodobacter sp.]|nr:tellurium resistance protein [Pseudorhodobacter sp.]
MANPEPQHFRPRKFPAPQFPPVRPKRFSRTPPAILPPIMGLLGLGLALRRASEALALAPAVAELVLGAASMLWLFALLAYAAKVAQRPAVINEDLRILPGRAGLAVMGLSMLLVAAAVVPYAPGLARGLLMAGLALHAVVAVLVIRFFVLAPPEAREVTPVWHLSFVGFIIGGLAAVPLGLTGLAQALLWGGMSVAAVIWGISLWQLLRRFPPAPLRPLLAIHLTPASLFATVAALLGQTGLALGFAALGGLILVALLAASRWLTVSGFSPLWGAFTFPVAAFASSLFALGLDATGIMVLMLALAIVPTVAFRVLKSWATGDLAVRTNATAA